jgi:hypothetical protein
MNERVAKMEQQVENIEKAVNRIEEAMVRHVGWEADKYDEMDKKFSGKWVEKVVIGVILVLIGSIFTVLNTTM